MKSITKAVVASLLAAASCGANSASILFAHVDDYGQYVDDGNRIRDMLVADGHTVATRYLDAAVYTDYTSFDQVFVYDLYSSTDNSATQQSNYTNIANWYNGLTNQNLIVDGRIISSTTPWVNPPETAWIQNYATQLDLRGGGLVMGTDHDAFANGGFNSILQQMNINPVTGNNPLSQALVDSLSPLFVNTLVACVADPSEQCINDNSTTGFVPTGLQPNGQTLTPVAYHGVVNQAFANAAVSSTIGSDTFGTCDDGSQPPCVVVPPTPGVPAPGPITLIALGLAGIGYQRRKQIKAA